MLIKVIDSFDTMNPPVIDNVFDGKKLSKKDALNEDLLTVASQLTTYCKIKIRDYGEDSSISDIKEVAKIALDVQKAFFDNKSQVTVNNNQTNISNSQLNHFKGLLSEEI